MPLSLYGVGIKFCWDFQGRKQNSSGGLGGHSPLDTEGYNVFTLLSWQFSLSCCHTNDAWS